MLGQEAARGEASGFEALVDGSPEPVGVYCGGRLVYANRALAVYLGYTAAGDLVGAHMSRFIDAHLDPGGDRDVLEACLSGDGWSREVRLVRLDGQSVVAQLRTGPLAFAGRRARALFVRDVTERAEASHALGRSEQTFRTIIERSPLAMCVVCADRLLYVNPAMLQYLGYDSELEMKRLGLRELADEIVHPADRARAGETFRALFAGPDAGRGAPEARGVRLDDVRLRSRRGGALRYCDMHGVLVMHDGMPAMVTTLHDHTERRAAADRMRLADRMSSLGTLAAGVAHEINNPLTYVIGNLELVAGQLQPAGEGGGEVGGALRRMRTGLDRIRRTVRALKTFTRADEDTIGPVDVGAVLDSCLEMAETHLRHRGRAVRAYPSGVTATGNDARLAQVFLNLLVNAAEALDEETRERNEVVVSAAASEGAVTIEVRDNGRGIAPEDLQRIFDPFFTTKPVGVGTGLGLFVCQGIVGSLGGEITVDSTPGEGTTVRVRLRPAFAEPAARRLPDDGPAHPRARILVIDDEPLVLELVRRVLQREHQVETVSRGREALDRVLAGESFTLILCDLMMPEMSGAELHARLASAAPDAAFRLAFMTGGAVSAAGELALERAANPCLDKPFQAAELLAFVRRQVARFGGPSAAQAG